MSRNAPYYRAATVTDCLGVELLNVGLLVVLIGLGWRATTTGLSSRSQRRMNRPDVGASARREVGWE
jgi:hypothetical protein